MSKKRKPPNDTQKVFKQYKIVEKLKNSGLPMVDFCIDNKIHYGKLKHFINVLDYIKRLGDEKVKEYKDIINIANEKNIAIASYCGEQGFDRFKSRDVCNLSTCLRYTDIIEDCKNREKDGEIIIDDDLATQPYTIDDTKMSFTALANNLHHAPKRTKLDDSYTVGFVEITERLPKSKNVLPANITGIPKPLEISMGDIKLTLPANTSNDKLMKLITTIRDL